MLAAWSQRWLRRVEAALAEVCPDAEPGLRDALLYPIQTGGKRIRPLLCLAAAESVGGDAAAALLPAVALELVHTYSLVHDDLPAMDDDDERRGRPTVHVVYGDATAILVGDALLTAAFEHIADSPPLVRELARAAGGAGMVGGQYLDIRGNVDGIEALMHLHRLKTGALLRAAVRMGGVAGGGSDAQLQALTRYGEAVGLAFQIADDVLDADEVAEGAGPPSYVRLFGKDGARAEARRLVEEAAAAVAGLPRPDPLVALAEFAAARAF
ncbi:MAG: polyprenyl synthetase family protein [Myxococcales bacterium]|nr:polyprenyl synthetase family protein [Myxococcales bacterium]